MSKRTIKGQTSIVTVVDNKIVIKKNVKFIDYQILNREVYWMKYLNSRGYNWLPTYIDHDEGENTIKMNYCGERITKKNLPSDWENQLIKIMDDLKNEKLKHNDIKWQDVLVLDKKLYLIDFGWMSTDEDDWTCNGTLKPITKPHHNHHDVEAIKKIKKQLKL